MNHPTTGSETFCTKMFVKDLMTTTVVCCTPWDTVRAAASLMKVHRVGAIVVVGDLSDPLLEGIVTDRDLCCSVVAGGKHADAVQVADIMSRIPVTCDPEYTLDECMELMQENQIRRIPVIDNRARCIGIVAQADIALHAPAAQVAKTIKEISRPLKPPLDMDFDRGYFYCGQPHEQDQVLLLNRRRELTHRRRVLI
jgi:CBS domain-containing protein